MDKAPDFGSGDCRFESCRGRLSIFCFAQFLSLTVGNLVIDAWIGIIPISFAAFYNVYIWCLITPHQNSLTAVGFEPTPFRTGA